MYQLIFRFAAVVMVASCMFTPSTSVANCPFCSAAGQTLRQEMQSMDVAGIATLVPDGRDDIDGTAKFRIEIILKGESLVKVGQEFQATYFGPGKSKKRFLMQGVDPRELVWSSPVPLTEEAEKYVQKLLKLPEDPVERLAFFQDYFEHPDPLLSRDCYDEFALSPYEDVIKLKPKMDHKKLVDWVHNKELAPDRKRLYFTMLGICGTEEDTVWMEKMIRSSVAEDRVGLDSLIAAFLNLKGEAGLPVVVDSFLKNLDSPYVDIFATVMALRFHSTEGTKLKKEAIAQAMYHLLDRPDLADLVIPDLARMEDWSQLDKLTKLFKDATDETIWIRMPIVNYARACPLPEAKEKLLEMEKIDPAVVKRSKTFFPAPNPANQKKKESSSIQLRPENHGILASSERPADRFLEINREAMFRQTRVASLPSDSASSLTGVRPEASIESSQPSGLNRIAPLAVVALASMTFGSIMWVIATDGR